MPINYDLEYTRLANKLTQLFRNEIRKLGLVSNDSKPHLVDSIQWTVKKTSNGYNLQMESFDYFVYLDSKYNITNNVFKTTEYRDIENKIADLEIERFLSEALKDIKTN